MKTILGALAAIIMLGGIAVSQPAEASCWPTPWGWQCSHPRPPWWYWHRHHHHHHHDRDRDQDWR